MYIDFLIDYQLTLMAEEDLSKFITKVNQLNLLIEMISSNPEKRILLRDCDNHDEVVKLATKWGFDIGKRWGES